MYHFEQTNFDPYCIIKRYSFIFKNEEYDNLIYLGSILSINEKLPMTRVHLTQEHFWFFLNRELPSLQLSFLWCTVPCIGTTENGIRHKWNHDILSLTSTLSLISMGKSNVVVLPENWSLALSIWWNNRNHFDCVFMEYLSGIQPHVYFIK